MQTIDLTRLSPEAARAVGDLVDAMAEGQDHAPASVAFVVRFLGGLTKVLVSWTSEAGHEG